MLCLNLRILAAKIIGSDIYPPVEKIFSIFFFFNKNNDLIVRNKILIRFKGKKNILSNLGVLIISNW